MPTHRNETSDDDLTRLLGAWQEGDETAEEALLPRVYDELRRIATAYMSRERPDHTLDPSALVHEAYLRISPQRGLTWEDRQRFFAFAAHHMRRVLVDHARQRGRLKRGGDHTRITFLDHQARSPERWTPGLLDLHRALEELAELDPERARLVELRFFGGLGYAEIAPLLGVSERTVKRQWRRARAWLHDRLQSNGDETGRDDEEGPGDGPARAIPTDR